MTQMELLGTFERGWDVHVEDWKLETRLEGDTMHAWLREPSRLGA